MSNKQNEKADKNLTLVGHLAELRKRIMYSAIVFIAATLFCYFYAEPVIRDMVSLADNVQFVFIAPAELVLVTFKLAVLGGLILAAPFIIIQVWLFVTPGLSGEERKYVSLAILIAGGFFIIGAIFAYKVVIPTILVFFMGFQLDVIKPMISFSSYLGFIITTVVSFGLIFELPILMVLLTRFGLVKVEFIKKNRKFIVLIIFVVAAVITPPDIISQTMLALPMIMLSELGIFLSTLASKKRKEKINKQEESLD